MFVHDCSLEITDSTVVGRLIRQHILTIYGFWYLYRVCWKTRVGSHWKYTPICSPSAVLYKTACLSFGCRANQCIFIYTQYNRNYTHICGASILVRDYSNFFNTHFGWIFFFFFYLSIWRALIFFGLFLIRYLALCSTRERERKSAGCVVKDCCVAFALSGRIYIWALGKFWIE